MNKVIVGIIALIVLVVGVMSLQDSNDDKTSDSSTNTTTTQQSANDNTADEQQADNDFGSVQTVIYDDNGFSPEMLTSKAGEKMIIENKTSSAIQVNSDQHPSHSENSELNVGSIEAGQSKSVTLTKKGTFGFHNHLNPDKNAKVVVQ